MTSESTASDRPLQDDPPPSEGHLVTLASILPFLYRSAGTILVSVAAALLIGIVYVLSTPPGYIATAELLIEAKKEPSFWTRQGLIDFTVDNAQVESELEILRSERIASAVINELRLTEDPEFASGGKPSDANTHRQAINTFMSRSSAVRIGQSYMIAVSFRSHDPEKASRIANAVTQAYLQDHIQAKIDSIKSANAWAQQRITDVGTELNNAARAVQSFKTSQGIVDAGSTSNQYMYVDKLTELEARVQSYRKLYESFLEGLTQNAQQASYPASAARIISPATTPLGKSYPKTNLVLMLSLLIGALSGLGIALVRHMLDRSVRTPAQLRQALGIECFGALPSQRVSHGVASLYEVGAEATLSPFVDALRAVKVAINPAAGPNKARVIGVTSLDPGEGKSTVAAGLALLCAVAGRHTLLIDGNFRHPSVSRELAKDAETGLFGLLLQPQQGLPDPIPVVHGKAGLCVIPTGTGEALANSSDALGSDRMKELLERLRGCFDVIVVDLPALGSAVDARAAAGFLDACLLVTEWSRTQLDALREPIQVLRAYRIPLLGAVINKSREGLPDFAGVIDAIHEWLKPRLQSAPRSTPVTTGVQYPFESRPEAEHAAAAD